MNPTSDSPHPQQGAGALVTGKNLFLLGIALMAVGAYVYFHPAAGTRVAEGAPAPAVAFSDLSGKQVSLSEYRGKVLLIDFWATWCDACREEMPDLKQLYARFHPEGLEFLAPSMDEEGRKALVPFVAENAIPWRVVLGNEEATQAYAIFGLPTKFLIDRKGSIARKYVGSVDPAELARDVQTLLNKKEGTAS